MTRLVVVFCIVMFFMSLTGIWKANKFGVSALWLLLAYTISLQIK